MSDPQDQSPLAPAKTPETPAAAAPIISLPPELDLLPPETKSSVLTFMMALIVRQNSGPDPETSKLVAQSEMHQETCRLEGYREMQKSRDKQGERDHEFRKKKLNHETLRNLLLYATCVLGIGIGLYLYVGKGEKTVGSNIVTACFVALLGGKALLGKEKE